MALIKGQAQSGAGHAVSLDLGDLARRGEMLKEAATQQARAIVQQAHEERARILEGAHEAGRKQGYEAGFKEGFEAGKAQAIADFAEQLKSTGKVWESMLEEFSQQREHFLTQSRHAVIELAVAIAQRVVHRTVELDPTVVEDQLREMLSLVAAPATLIVRVHPDDESLVRDAVPAIKSSLPGGLHIRLVSDSTVSRGSCLARTLSGASIDASLETQLDRVVADVLPDWKNRRASRSDQADDVDDRGSDGDRGGDGG